MHKLNLCEKELLEHFYQEEQLPSQFSETAEAYYLPLSEELAELANQSSSCLLIGINGCQGSGKSTLAALLTKLLTHTYQKNVANLSIDDFYLTRQERQDLANKVHPLFKTRGVPGTHDTRLLQKTLTNLTNTQASIPIPRFDKSIDDRSATSQWDYLNGPADIIILEGWCIGVCSQKESALITAINTLEKEEDPKGIWRRKINKYIEKEYMPLFAQLDRLVMLKAPSFDCVYLWREKQEEKLRKKKTEQSLQNKKIMNSNELRRFIEHYQRLTEHMLCFLPQKADIVFELSPEHNIINRLDNEHR